MTTLGFVGNEPVDRAVGSTRSGVRLAPLLLLLLACRGAAQTNVVWSGAQTAPVPPPFNWSDTENWQGGQVPGTNDTAEFGAPMNGVVTVDGAGASVGDLRFTRDGYVLNGGVLTLCNAGGTVDVPRPLTQTLNGSLGGGVGITKSGFGALILAATNTYTGATRLTAGVVELRCADSLPSSTELHLGVVDLSLGGFDQTVAGLVITSNPMSPGTRVTGIGSGRGLTVTGALTVTGLSIASLSGGTVRLNAPTGDVVLEGDSYVSLGVSVFDVNVDNFRAGRGGALTGRVDLSGAGGARATITASRVYVGDGASADGDDAYDFDVFLGQDTTIQAGLLELGFDTGRGTVSFGSGAADPVVRIYGKSGPGTRLPNAFAGFKNVSSTADARGRIDLTLGKAEEVLIDNLLLGYSSRTGAARGQGELSFDWGTVDVNHVTLGESTAGATSGGAAEGVLTVGGDANVAHTAVLKVNTSLVLGKKAGAVPPAGALNVRVRGTATLSTDIVDGGGISAVALDGGTLDMGGGGACHAIGSAAQPIDTLSLLGGTLVDVAEINGGGTVTKSGAGTLVLGGTHAWSGRLVVVGGTVRLAGTQVFHSGQIIENSATLILGTAAQRGCLDLRGLPRSADGIAIVDNSGGGTVQGLGYVDLTPGWEIRNDPVNQRVIVRLSRATVGTIR